MFLGRYRTPRLAYMEDLVLTVVRDIAIGTLVDASIANFLTTDSQYLQNMPPADPADQTIFFREPVHLELVPFYRLTRWYHLITEIFDHRFPRTARSLSVDHCSWMSRYCPALELLQPRWHQAFVIFRRVLR